MHADALQLAFNDTSGSWKWLEVTLNKIRSWLITSLCHLCKIGLGYALTQ